MFENSLNPIEIRVLGALLEKERTTPEYYPMTINALVAACNQKSNRWPVTSLTDADVSEALRSLRVRKFAAEISGAGMRVPKYAQRFTETLNMGRREPCILCVLMLRGPQTLGEIKDRSERMYNFADLEEVEGVLRKLAEAGMAVQLARQPGQKEPRYAQLLGGPVDSSTVEMEGSATQPESPVLHVLEARVAALEAEVAELRRRLNEVL